MFKRKRKIADFEVQVKSLEKQLENEKEINRSLTKQLVISRDATKQLEYFRDHPTEFEVGKMYNGLRIEKKEVLFPLSNDMLFWTGVGVFAIAMVFKRSREALMKKISEIESIKVATVMYTISSPKFMNPTGTLKVTEERLKQLVAQNSNT